MIDKDFIYKLFSVKLDKNGRITEIKQNTNLTAGRPEDKFWKQESYYGEFFAENLEELNKKIDTAYKSIG